ncbi:hypothetical protein E2562_000239 [Oryza meyeriana var. granulata]|uniref:Uncharacterized protein n=1 Tax=Oryza meyeriana var. granulata TaxID=110450 RepID=A0A6G1CL30_9ORYZ|nr:hypothetical protein E2562_000239 [Oryza meyeriana var. granulata]
MENSSTPPQPVGGGAPTPPQDATTNLISALTATHAAAFAGNQEDLLTALANVQVAQDIITTATQAPAWDASTSSSATASTLLPVPTGLSNSALIVTPASGQGNSNNKGNNNKGKGKGGKGKNGGGNRSGGQKQPPPLGPLGDDGPLDPCAMGRSPALDRLLEAHWRTRSSRAVAQLPAATGLPCLASSSGLCCRLRGDGPTRLGPSWFGCCTK